MAKILVIDDDQFAREALLEITEDMGHSVLTANDGDKGMKELRQQHFDVVVTDLIMPNMNGIDVLCQIKRDFALTKVIVISAGSSMTPLSYLDQAKKLGADDVLAKPFSYTDLQTSIENALVV